LPHLRKSYYVQKIVHNQPKQQRVTLVKYQFVWAKQIVFILNNNACAAIQIFKPNPKRNYTDIFMNIIEVNHLVKIIPSIFAKYYVRIVRINVAMYICLRIDFRLYDIGACNYFKLFFTAFFN